jgi:WD40 repeat protein
MSFSPKNPRLIATVGSDGKMALVDIGAKTNDPSAAVDIAEPLTAVSFHEDAIHCAAGTSGGIVFMYDWRNLKKPIARLDTATDGGSHSPVYALAFQVY